MVNPNNPSSVALTIAGSDSGGGAGIQADLKTFEAYRVFGTSVVTALTAQNSLGVQGVLGVGSGFVRAQLNAVLTDFHVGAIKTGMLFDEDIILTVAERLKRSSMALVVDPVMVSTSGHNLLNPHAVKTILEDLLPLALVITPNIAEAAELTGMKIENEADMVVSAQILSTRYPDAWILVKGGHLSGEVAKDVLVNGDDVHWLDSPRIDTQDTHGTGCTLSAAITAGLAQGWPVLESVRRAKAYINGCLQNTWSGLGKGRGSLKHFSTTP